MKDLGEKLNDIVSQTFDTLYGKFGGKAVLHTSLISKTKAILEAVHDVTIKTCREYYDVIDAVVNRYEKEVGVKPPIGGGTLVKGGNDNEWFQKKKNAGTMTKRFDRYDFYLRKQGFYREDIKKIKEVSEKILSHCANPDATEDRRRGLVVGDVQSGKTANYLALINLAIDYGYNLIVLLAGIPEDLRHQTQSRVDEGVLGAYSETIGNNIEYCGIGMDIKDCFGIPLTNRVNDFKKFIMKNTNTRFKDFNGPVILVIKKNYDVLNTVLDKLEAEAKNHSASKMLIIDDEADNASVSGSGSVINPSTINKQIRGILNKFPVASYVGFTATPFANIFINPDDLPEEDLELFPSDFICQLPTPSTYFGLEKVFGDETHSLRIVDEKEPLFFPEKHKKAAIFEGLSNSLKEAIQTFILGNVIRTLRGQGKKHRSMMINISRYNCPQDDIAHSVEEYLAKLKNIVEQDCNKPTERFIQNSDMKELYDLFNGDFFAQARQGGYDNSTADYDAVEWEKVKAGLYQELKKIKVALINGEKKGDDRLNYDDYKDVGARVIVVGGYILSRGLTLEGLMVSYYSRNSGAYDTLLQMGRWFGYRPGYEDICRVYMTNKNVKCFRAVADAVEDLKCQFKKMEIEGKAPREFGLAVKTSPECLETRALLVTAKNKMFGTSECYMWLNYGGVVADTSKISLDRRINEYNIEVFNQFRNKLALSGEKSSVQNKLFFEHIAKDDVADFVEKLSVHYLNKKFNVKSFSDYIRNSKDFLEWDVLVENGESDNTTYMEKIGFKGWRPVLRQFNIDEDNNVVCGGKDKNTIINPLNFKIGIGITPEQENEILEEKRKLVPSKRYSNLSTKDYLKLRKRPLLVVYAMDLRNPISDKNDVIRETNERCNKEVEMVFGTDNPVMAFAIGFPGDVSKKVMVKYIMNKVMVDQIEKDIDSEDEMEGVCNDD
ncbi:MAG: DEAD/DEAH box helicase family protein [Phascolarctobacterium sp.]|nr:DEAD/DEAH box helicase family protein [Candidatus Phascolarctobacterium caballi]